VVRNRLLIPDFLRLYGFYEFIFLLFELKVNEKYQQVYIRVIRISFLIFVVPGDWWLRPDWTGCWESDARHQMPACGAWSGHR
jgi:hypothetical protein